MISSFVKLKCVWRVKTKPEKICGFNFMEAEKLRMQLHARKDRIMSI